MSITVTPAVATPITVSDIERLAKAGVKIDWADIRSQVTPDPETPPVTPVALEDAARERFIRTPAGQHLYDETFHRPEFKAVREGDKVYLFVHFLGKAPQVFMDDWGTYPSDALMAQIYLYMEFAP